ncbi:Sulfur carrier protein ThiS [Anoxybacillus sp. P3H1B]|uniref:Sulfur carrier protein ThiS n=1 Tax=Anoxybacteroides rupiense TaxID=311460 RepID=A0ABD5IW78_9BACL|nr:MULTISPECIES: sulfur carrier protein ThiS [Anoxybacillus]KXG10041.1 Sulfur carrier protein ThiS [Anoxybacillus sp. P3H1B]MBB3907629.1 sulfur carrier protein [Anoxybacillus rupiensis]MED5052181.1 sulfur carrier protein ThiS [Anoxybacillus rupiensis]OQM46488.1 thiamine biosynthesis protein ThiS [Anoxybacillus sp. UARK-01]
MELLINGEMVHVPDHVRTVADLLVHFQLDQKIVIVEVNADIIEKPSYAEISLCHRDRIEIVHFVGGG